MKRIEFLVSLLCSPHKLAEYATRNKYTRRFISDRSAIEILYKNRFGRKINLENPTTFNEKLLWLTLNDRNPQYTKMVDKYEAKDYISKCLGKDTLTPHTLQICKSFEDIDFGSLPSRYVIKTTHDSGSVVIVTKALPLNFEKAKTIIKKSLKNNYFWYSREWVYKNVEPRVIVEEYIETDNLYPTDFKFFCFNGNPVMCAIITGRDSKAKMDFVDLRYNRQPISQRYENSKILPPPPSCWEDMIMFSTKLSKDIPFLRVDFFCDKAGNCLVGELTFTPSSGLIPFDNAETDLILGNKLDITKIK